jgi:hypothetical protein
MRGGFIVVHWDGAYWRRLPTSSIGSTSANRTGPALLFVYLKGLLVLGPNDVWVVGGPPPFAAHWNGTTWHSYPMPRGDTPHWIYETRSLDSVVERARQHIVVSGDAGMFEWKDGSWARSRYSLYDHYIADPLAVRGTELWGVGLVENQMVRLNASTWVPIGKPLAGVGLTHVTADPHGDVWAVGLHTGVNPQRPVIVHYHC